VTGADEYVTTTDGVRLFVRTLGRGAGATTLIVPNGLYFVDDVSFLAADRTVVVYDVRNRGRSDTVTDRSKLARGILQDVDDLDVVRRHAGADRADLLGHSYMGLVVAVHAMEYAAHIDRVVQIGPSPPRAATQYPPDLAFNDGTLAEVFSTIGQLQNEGLSDPEERCRRFWSALRYLYVTDRKDVDRMAWGRCELPNERNFMQYFQGELMPSMQRLDLSPAEFARAAMPVLTIHGRKDRSAPYGGGRDWAAQLPNARLLTIDNGGHAPWIEAPEVVFGAVKTFLNGTWPDGAETVE
jgi:pimeloyl-ACP methyl ester carboxylesterase